MTAGPSASPETPEFVLVDGWRADLGRHGIRVSKGPSPRAPAPRRAPRVLPEPFPGLVGRNDEVDAVLEALRSGPAVNVWGECGIGKTSVLRRVAYRAAAEFADRPVIFLTAARQPMDDLLHEIHRCLYETPTHVKQRPDEVREHLRGAQAVLVLDDVTLADGDLADLLWTLRGSIVVLSSPVRRKDPALRPVELTGLDAEAATELFQRALGSRRLARGEHEEVQRLVGPDVLRGHPLRVRQAAALVESGRRSAGELVRMLAAGDPAQRLTQECRSALTPEQRQVVGVLALAAGSFLPVDLVTHACAAGQVAAQLRALRKRRLIEDQHDWFGLPVCSLGEPRQLIGPSLNLGLALRGVVAWLQRPDLSADGLLSVSGGMLTMLEFAGEAGEWDSVLRIVRAIEPALITSGRWEQWRSALESGLHAAEQLHDNLERAYHLHQLGSRALCLGDRTQATQLLKEAKSLRSRHGARDAQRVTTHNLALLTSRVWWRQRATVTAAAAAVVVLSAAGSLLAAMSQPTLSAATKSPTPTPSLPSPITGTSLTPSTGPPPPPLSLSSSSSSSSPRRATTVLVSGVLPDQGAAAGGDRVTITGRGFAGATEVDFGSASARFTVDSDRQITATSPAGAGAVDITVTTPAGSFSTGPADRFTYLACPPNVSSISPAQGLAGDSITITGSCLTDVTEVDFGGASAAFSSDSASQITATAPAGSDTVDITVVNRASPSATSPAGQFTYIPVPAVTGVTPDSGSVDGGDTVTITGSGFISVTDVDFGGTSAQFTVDSAGQITATSPAGSDTVDITVVNRAGPSATSPADQFYYYNDSCCTSDSTTNSPLSAAQASP